jgi:hypothetical protein
MVSVHLWIYLCALINTNKLSSVVAGETVAELAMNLAYPCIILFYIFTFSFLYIHFHYEFHSYLSIC